MRRSPWLRLLVAPIAALVLASCGEGRPDSPLTPTSTLAKSTSTGATLIECPTNVSRDTTKTIGVLGGTIEIDGHKLVVPANALTASYSFNFSVPASNYVEVAITATDMMGQQVPEGQLNFMTPASLTISYSRCTRSNINKYDALEIWYLDPVTGAPKEKLDSTDDRTNKKVTAGLDHLSDYAVSQP